MNIPHHRHPTPGAAFKGFFGDCATDKDAPTCLEAVDKDADPKKIEEYLKDYLVFTVVKNPYTRAASAYTYLNYAYRFQFANEGTKAYPYCAIKWEYFCQHPRLLARHCRAFDRCCGQKD